MLSINAIASSSASRVPDPMEKCAVCAASPRMARLPLIQRSHHSRGNTRQLDLLVINGVPCSVSLKISAHSAALSASLIPSNPAASNAARPHSTINVLRVGENR